MLAREGPARHEPADEGRQAIGRSRDAVGNAERHEQGRLTAEPDDASVLLNPQAKQPTADTAQYPRSLGDIRFLAWPVDLSRHRNHARNQRAMQFTTPLRCALAGQRLESRRNRCKSLA